MGWLDDLKKKAQQGAQQAQSAVQQGVQAANQAYNTGKQAAQQAYDTGKQVAQQAYNTGTQVVNQVKQNAPGVVSNVQNGIQKGIQKANDVANTTKNMVQNVKNSFENAIATGKEMYNVGKAGYEGAVSGIKDYYAGDSNTQAPPQETDWAAEYDKVMQGGQGTSTSMPITTPTTTPNTSTNTPTSTTPALNPDGTVTVTQPNGQQVNTSPAASATLGAGAGQWQSELDGIMNQIMNREKFSFDMNGDAMYQQYADMYQNQANLGMQNAMAQAAALTGGYGSSYGQMVGQQAYAQQMQGLNDVALDLYDRAYNQYQDEGNQLAQQYAMIADREQQAYNRAVDDRNFNYQKYLDELEQSNYEKELGYRAERDAVADSQWDQSFEYQKYLDELNQSNYDKEFEYQQNRDTVADERYNKEFEYQQNRDTVADERYNKEFEYQQNRDTVADERYNKEFEYQQNRDTVADERYNKEFEYQQGRDAINDERYENEWAASEEQRKADNKYRDDTLKEDQRQFDESMNWQVDEFNKMYGYTDENGEYHEGINEKMAKQEHDWQVDEFNKMYGYTDENGEYHKGYYETQSDKEFDRMYGDLKKDDEGNIIGGGYQTQRDAIEDKRYDDALKAQEEANNPNTTYEGDGTLKGESVPKQLAGVSGLTTTNTGLFDDNGYFKTAAVVSGTTAEGDLNDGTPEVGKGTMTYNIGGKEVTLKTGTSPYTNTVNPDAKNGVMENGYQPDNYGGYELEEEGTTDVINGVRTPVYQIKDSNPPVKLIWDDASNQYISYGDQELPDPNDITINSNDVASPPKNPVDKPQFNGPAEPPQETLIEDEIPPEWKEEISGKLYTAEEAGTITNPTLPTGSESPEQVVEKMMGMGWKDVSNAPYSQATRDQLIAEGKMVAVDVNGKIKYLMR